MSESGQNDGQAQSPRTSYPLPDGASLPDLLRKIPLRTFTASAIRTVLTAAFGCIMVAACAPVIKWYWVGGELGRVNQFLSDEGNRSSSHAEWAMSTLQRHEPWAMRYPSVAADWSRAIVTCYMKLGNLSMAKRQAMWMCEQNGTLPPPRLPRSADGLMDFLVDGPTWVVNRIVLMRRGCDDSTWDSQAGFNIILTDLEASGKRDQLKLYAEEVRATQPSNLQARDVLNYISYSNTTAIGRVKQGTRYVSANNPPPRAADVAREAPGPSPDLRPREAELLSQIAAMKKTLAEQRPLSDVEQRYNTALGEYREVTAKAKSLQTRWENAEGAVRMSLMDQLHRLKGEVSRREKAFLEAKGQLEDWKRLHSDDSASNPELNRLEVELAKVRREIGKQ